MSLLSDVVVIFLRSVIVLIPNGQYLDCAFIAFSDQYYHFGLSNMYISKFVCFFILKF